MFKSLQFTFFYKLLCCSISFPAVDAVEGDRRFLDPGLVSSSCQSWFVGVVFCCFTAGRGFLYRYLLCWPMLYTGSHLRYSMLTSVCKCQNSSSFLDHVSPSGCLESYLGVSDVNCISYWFYFVQAYILFSHMQQTHIQTKLYTVVT